ncbi:MAG: hypothetical protein JW917_01840 [Ignavibacteria bacterium]|nr:hypothetical protein [Ignavibacteria bacterium]
MNRTLFIFPLLILVLFICGDLQAQQEIDSCEINWRVQELSDFHEVIHEMWHEAYPSKDISKLKSFVPDIKVHIEKINNVSLPGILQDKVNKWKEALQLLNSTAEQYYAAAEGDGEQIMLDAAEELHSKYEMMVRTIAPLMKEVDLYHQVLYIIYHKYLPNKDYASISNVIDDLITRAEDIKTGKMSKRVESKKDEFLAVTDELIEATKALKETLSSDDTTLIDSAIDFMHTKYMKLEQLFD